MSKGNNMIKVRSENIIYFVTVCGFFIGFMFCIVNINEPTDILFYTLEITLFFYLLAHVAVMNFVDVESSGQHKFKHSEYEDISSYFIREIEEREEKMNILLRPLKKDAPQVVRRKKRHDGSYKKKAA